MEAESVNNSCSSPRQRFTIELRPGETTIVSWKKLIKEANNSDKSSSLLTREAHKVQVALDEYFQDENPTPRHGNTVNKEKIEQIDEPISSTARNLQSSSGDCQLKKRKNYAPKAFSDKVDDISMNKQAKLGHAKPKIAANNVPTVGQSSSHSQSSALESETRHDRKSQHAIISSVGSSRKKLSKTFPKSEYPLYSEISHKDASVRSSTSKDTEKQRIETSWSKNSDDDLKVTREFLGHPKYEDKKASKQLRPQGKRTSSDSSELALSSNSWQTEKSGSNGLPDLNIPASPIEPLRTTCTSKDPSRMRPKGSTLERAIRDLEKVVAESRPSHMEVQNAVNSSIAIRRRLPHEVKQKLAKVARVASSQGKITEELVHRLMSILGHLVQLRTLKRNLREMVLLGQSAKREKAERFQQIKMEVIEMIKQQEASKLGKKGGIVEKYELDNVLENKICDLYYLYIQGMDEDKGSQIRKFYTELAELWPHGAMDNHGIKKAICRAKEHRKASYNDEKVQNNLSKRSSMPRSTDIYDEKLLPKGCPSAVNEKLVAESNTDFLAPSDKMVSNATTYNHHVATSVRTSSPLLKSSNMDSPKFERMTLLTSKEPWEPVKRVDTLSNKESHKSRKRSSSHPDSLNHQLAAPSSM